MAIDLDNLPDKGPETPKKKNGVDLSNLPDTHSKKMRGKYRTFERESPDEFAKVRSISERTGLPEKVAQQNQQEAQRRAEEPDWDALEQTSPVTARELARNNNLFRLAKDDTESLSAFEQIAKGYESAVQWTADSFYDIDMGYAAGKLRHEQGLLGLAQQEGRATPEQERRIEELQMRLQNLRGSGGVLEEASKIVGQMAQSLPQSLSAGAASGLAAGGAATVAGQAGPQVLTPEEIVTVPAAAIAGFSAGFTAKMAETAYKVEAGHSYLDMIEQGVDPETAATVSTGVGLANAALETVGVGLVSAPFKKALSKTITKQLTNRTVTAAAGRFAKDYAKAWTGEVSTEVMQEGVSILGAEYAKYLDDPDVQSKFDTEEGREEIASQLIQIFEQVGKGMLLLALPGASVNFAVDYRRARKAGQNRQTMEALGDTAKASKLRERAPAELGAFVDQVTADGPIENVYVNSQDFVEYFQNQGIDPRQVAQEVPSIAKQFDEAITTSGDLRIPLSEYTSKIAGTEYHEGLMEHVRFSPEDMSPAEARQWRTQEAERFQAEAEEVLARAEDRGTIEQSADEVYQSIKDEILRTGRFPEDVANQYAALHRAFAITMGERTGMSPAEVYQRYGLKVSAQQPAEFSARLELNQEEFNELAANQTPVEEVQQRVDSRRSERRETADEGREDRVAEPDQQRDDAPPAEGIEVEELSFEEAGTVPSPDSPGMERAARAAWARLGTDSPYFQRWFGDSKMRRHDGTPVVFYHGTDAPITEFDFTRAGEKTGFPASGLGVWLTADPNTAANYGGNVLSGYVRLENPYVVAPADLQSFESVEDARAFAEELQARGHDGIYLSGTGQAIIFESNQYKTADNVGTFDPDSPKILRQDTGDQRGKIQFPTDLAQGPSIISLLENADLSTFLHESGHFFLEITADIANQENAPQQVRDDLNTLLDWFGVESWDQVSVKQHEEFARGFEAYLFEGEAPSLELKSVFSRFRSWLVNVYRHIRNLNVELTDEVRGVMDRLLATDKQIQEAETANNYRPLFESAEQAGMTAQEWQDYQNLNEQARQDAETELTSRSLKDMKWLANAKARVLKDLQKEAREIRKEVRAEAARDIMARPIYQAHELIARGRLPQGELPEGFEVDKLSRAALVDMYGEEGVWTQLQTRGKNRLVTREGGYHPDVIAELFGFSSGDAMVRQLADMRPAREVIEELTDQRMLERYGDLTDQKALERAAEAAVHNEARAKFVHTELKALSKRVGQQSILKSAAKDYAEQVISRKQVKDAGKTAQYAAAEARAARLAGGALGRGNAEQAATHKRAQLLNNYLVRAASNARTETDKTVRYLKKFERKGTRKNIDPDYMEQIDAILARFDLRKGVTLKEIKRRQNLRQWVAEQEERGFDPMIDDSLLDEAQQQSYKELTVEELKGLRDSVRNIEHLGRLKNKLLTARRDRNINAAIDEAVAVIEKNRRKKSGKRDIETRLPKDETLRTIGSYFASHRKLASIVREMDGFKDGGTVWQLLMEPLNDRSNQEAVAREKATIRLGEIFNTYNAKDMAHMYEKQYIPEIEDSMSRMGRLAVALNWGNMDNRQKLMDGYGWSEYQVRGILNTLEEKDWEFVQNVWDFIDEFWPQIQEKEKRVSGVAPEKVQATPVDTPYGTFRGGYYPLKYDDRQSPRAYADAAKEAADQAMKGKYSRASTRRGHTKERVQGVERPVRLDFGVMFEHVDQVIHDLAFHEYLVDANRILGSEKMQSAIIDAYGIETYKMMQSAVTDVAAGDVPAQKAWESAVNWFRTGTSIAAMGWNLGTALLQPLGLSQSVVRIGPKYVAKGLSRWLRDAGSMENTARWINEKSDFMRLRGKTMQREINEIRNKVTEVSARGKIMGKAQDSYFWLIAKAQRVADIPTWLGQYEKAMDQGFDETEAIAQADQAVLDSQGGGQIKDLASIQRGGPLMKLWTNFYSYFNVTYNLTAESLRRTQWTDPVSVGRLASDLFMLYTVPAVMGWVMREALIKGECERGTDLECVARELTKEQAGYTLGIMIGVRELSSAVQGFYGYEGPAGTRFFAELSGTIRQVQQGEVDKALIKSLNQSAGIVFHYPASQVQKTLEGYTALREGETDNPMALLMGPPKDD